MAAFVHTTLADNSFTYLRGGKPAIAEDPSGFDIATGKILFRGTLTQLRAKFELGSTSGDAALPNAPSGSQMLCAGIVGQPVTEFSHIWADVQWRGIGRTRNTSGIDAAITHSSSQHIISVTLTAGTQAVNFPFERDGNQIIAGRPFCPPPGPGETTGLRSTQRIVAGGTVITTAVNPWRVRVLGRQWSAHVKGITIGTRGSMLQPPKLKIPQQTLFGGSVRFNWATLPDPLVTWTEDTKEASGWWCANYQPPTSEYALGDKILGLWSADYEWIDRLGPG